MNPEYQALRSIADKLFYRFKDVTDDRAASSSIASEVRNVVEDFEMNKNPHSIEDRVKRIIEGLRNIDDHSNSTMDSGHVDELTEAYEDLREHIRKLSNY